LRKAAPRPLSRSSISISSVTLRGAVRSTASFEESLDLLRHLRLAQEAGASAALEASGDRPLELSAQI
jgi:hypothetical protein